MLNEDKLFMPANSILIGDSVPEGDKIAYRKGDVIINIGEKMEQEPIYICIEAGAPGKWMYIQGFRVLKESPVVEDTQVDTVTFNQDLSVLIAEYSKLQIQEEPLDVDLSNTYMTIATIDDPEFAAAEKHISFNGIDIVQKSRLSIGNGNFIEFDQYIDNGTDIQLSLFTLAVAGDSTITIAAEDYKDIEFKVTLENPTEVEKIQVYKGAKWQNENYNVNEIGHNEYELEIVNPLTPAGWTPDLDGGTAWILFDFRDAEGNNMFANGGQVVTKRVIDGVDKTSGVEELKQFTAEDGSKEYRGFAYLNVYNDHGYVLEYSLAFLDGSCKPQKIIIHVPANVVE